MLGKMLSLGLFIFAFCLYPTFANRQPPGPYKILGKIPKNEKKEIFTEPDPIRDYKPLGEGAAQIFTDESRPSDPDARSAALNSVGFPPDSWLGYALDMRRGAGLNTLDWSVVCINTPSIGPTQSSVAILTLASRSRIMSREEGL